PTEMRGSRVREKTARRVALAVSDEALKAFKENSRAKRQLELIDLLEEGEIESAKFPQYAQAIRALSEKGIVRVFEAEVRRTPTSLKILDGGGDPILMPEQKRAVEALHDAETRYRLLFEHSPIGIVIIDPSTARPVEFNETAHRQLGYSREEFARLSISDIEVIETPEETRLRIAKVMREGMCCFYTRQRTRQGEIREVHVIAQFFEISGKSVYHCI
ncbi:MAG TPA: PAS domain S-box protein, partial [Synergistaceae bacterium]|nr:PAS domain S-box protein [Synergistaceae bacterium]